MKASPPASSVPIPFRARARHWWKKEILPLLIFALILFSIRSSLADWNDVPSGSMRPTILEGDRIFVNKLAYDLKVRTSPSGATRSGATLWCSFRRMMAPEW